MPHYTPGDPSRYAELEVDSSQTPITLTLQSTFYALSAGWVVGAMGLRGYTSANGVITVVTPGPITTTAQITYSGANNQVYQFAIFKNGALLPGHTTYSNSTNISYPASRVIVGTDQSAAGDTYDIRVACTTAAAQLFTTNLINFSVFGI